MIRTFGFDLKSFALAVDNLSKQSFESIKDATIEYLRNAFDITNVELLTQTLHQQRPSLQPIWNPQVNQFGSYFLDDDHGEPNGVCAYAFKNEKRLWVVAGDDQTLTACPQEGLCELWHGDEAVPGAFQGASREARTLIIFPLENLRRTVGVMYFEAKKRLLREKLVEEEIVRIAESLQTLYLISEESEIRAQHTIDAMETLRIHQQLQYFHIFEKPKLFVSYSSKADKAITGKILAGLQRYGNYVDIYNWADDRQAGNIPQRLRAKIDTCRAAICYFSEPRSAEGSPGFADNPNVLFEAGMIEALIQRPEAAPVRWIPIRERDSDETPFNFQTDRIIYVERDGGSLNAPQFEDDLDRAVRCLLEEDLGLELSG